VPSVRAQAFLPLGLISSNQRHRRDHASIRLWLGFEGEPLAAHSIYCRITRVTDHLLGVKINPHSFRACAATSLADRSPADARLAAPLLGHRYFATTERHYIRARQLEASRKVHATLAEIRSPDRR
jgi:integrase